MKLQCQKPTMLMPTTATTTSIGWLKPSGHQQIEPYSTKLGVLAGFIMKSTW